MIILLLASKRVSEHEGTIILHKYPDVIALKSVYCAVIGIVFARDRPLSVYLLLKLA